MGYTHYYNQSAPFSDKKWKAFRADVERLFEHDSKNDKLLAKEYSDINSPPLVDDDKVIFNGKDDDGHETFLISKVPSSKFNFCKTACKPYDLYVVACLVLAKIHFGKGIELSSDGELKDWQDGIRLVNGIFGYDIKTDKNVDELNNAIIYNLKESQKSHKDKELIDKMLANADPEMNYLLAH